MADPTVVVFDTTLRDGEQAPGFSMRIEEKLRLARQLDGWGSTSSRPAFPSRPRPTPKPSVASSTEIRRPVIAALARCAAGDIDAAGAALEPAARPRIHTFIATSDLHLERKLRMTRAPASTTPSPRLPARARSPTMCSSPRRMRRGATAISLRSGRGGDRGRRDHRQPARHRRLLHARRDPRVLHRGARPRAERRARGVQHALSRRSRAGRRQQPGGDSRRGAPGRMHDQRHWRARRQCFARRDRDGVAGAARARRLHDGSAHAVHLPDQPAAHAADRRGGAGQQGHRRTQRVRARGGHPPGRHAQGSAHLRDHAAPKTSACRSRRWSSASIPGVTPCRSAARSSGSCSRSSSSIASTAR